MHFIIVQCVAVVFNVMMRICAATFTSMVVCGEILVFCRLESGDFVDIFKKSIHSCIFLSKLFFVQNRNRWPTSSSRWTAERCL